MSPLRPNGRSSFSKHSIISLSSFDTVSSFATNQFISHQNNNTNLFNKKQSINTNSFDSKLDQIINEAVESFEQILAQCASPSNTTLVQDINSKNDANSKFEVKKRYDEDLSRPFDRKPNFKGKHRQHKFNCRKWCEEQNRRFANYYNSIDDDTNNTSRSKNRNIYGSTFYCRKALLQKPDGITYILVRKRFD